MGWGGFGGLSHPAWVCGLKPHTLKHLNNLKSHTLRGCVDWNLIRTEYWGHSIVTPCVGVWIETDISLIGLVHPLCHTLRGCVDWNDCFNTNKVAQPSHTLRGCVDWNGKPAEALYYFMGHTLRGCVDWNWKHTVRFSTILVTPCVGVWIETAMRKKYAKKQLSHPAWVCGLKRWNTWS